MVRVSLGNQLCNDPKNIFHPKCEEIIFFSTEINVFHKTPIFLTSIVKERIFLELETKLKFTSRDQFTSTDLCLQ